MSPPRILVVDDDRHNVVLLKNVLVSLGYEPEHAESGFEALERLRGNIDLVLLDVLMPEMDGFEAARRIRDDPIGRDIPIIMVTVLDSKRDRLRAVECGTNDFISKPIDALELQVRVASLLKMKNAQDRLKASLLEKEVLLREIHHRVKNNLAVISSLLGLQSRYAKDEFHRQMFADSQDRIRSIALAHEKLYQSENLSNVDISGYVGCLVDHLTVSTGRVGKFIELTKEIEDMTLTLETLVPLGFILTELVSNCLKHAFPLGGRGCISVHLRRTKGDNCELVIADNGIGLPEDFSFERPWSLGLELVKIFVRQLKGKIEVIGGQGAAIKVTFRDGD